MTFDELKQKAESGDVQAMTALGDAIHTHYTQQNEEGKAIIESLPWYEQAAKLGSSYGAIMALVGGQMIACVHKDSGDWNYLINAGYSAPDLALTVMRSADSTEEMRSEAMNAVDFYNYNLALGLYSTGKTEDAAAVLDGMGIKPQMTRLGTILRGLCLCATGHSREAYEWLRVLEGNGKAILPDCADKYDTAIVAIAYASLSMIYRTFNNNCNRAREILLEGLAVIDEPKLNAVLQQKLSHYRKKMFGGYQYVE